MIASKKKNQKVAVITIPWTRTRKTDIPLTIGVMYVAAIVWTGLWSIPLGYIPYESMFLRELVYFPILCGLLLFGFATSKVLKIKNVILLIISTIFFSVIAFGILYLFIFSISLFSITF